MSENKQTNLSQRNMSRLKDEEQVRKRPGVIFGTNDEWGAYNGINEIFANVFDEGREGFGKQMILKIEKDNVFTVTDDGRGLPMHWNEAEQMYNWELALCTLYASGKYDESQYTQGATGLNGLGLTSIQYASEFMEVWSTYDGVTYYMSFKKGKPVTELQKLKPIREGTGTTIKFKPDTEVFPALKVKKLPAELFIMNLSRQAMLLGGFKIIIDHFEFSQPIELYYENGISEYIQTLSDKTIMPKAVEFFDSAEGMDDTEYDIPDIKPYKVNMKVVFNFSRVTSDEDRVKLTEIYHNASYMFEGGETVAGFEAGIVAAFTNFARMNGKIGKNEKFVYKDISDMLLCVGTTEAPGYRTWFRNQTKGAINNVFIGKAFRQFIFDKFTYFFTNNQSIADKVIAQAVLNKTAREEGAEVSKKVINKLSKEVKFGSKPKNFTDCTTKNVMQREIYIVEGLSAKTSVVLARDPSFQAIMPIRGKIINCIKEKLTRVLNSEVIIDLFRVLGCGIEAKSEYIEDLPKFDINKLKWGKIIICTDADIDGKHIICLVITMFYVLAPSLLKAGKVFIAETPLYDIRYKGNVEFAYNDNEKDAILAKLANLGIKDNQIKINRSKGLGENDPEEMSISTMKPASRRLIPVEYPENDQDLAMYFNTLLGDDIEMRRLLINEYFETVEALD